MLGYKVPASRRKRDEGEKPFWISYADLMTAMMVLFLVVMSVSLLVVIIKVPPCATIEDPIPRKWLDYESFIHLGTYEELWLEILENERLKALIDKDAVLRQQRSEQMRDILTKLQEDAAKIKSCNINVEQSKDALTVIFTPEKNDPDSTLNKKVVAMFDSNSYQLKDTDKQCIREFVPSIYQQTHENKWFKRVAVEGFTDTKGAYLLNLNLSLQRAQSVVCSVLAPSKKGELLSEHLLGFVQQKFVVGGFSFNSTKPSDEESRRVELRLDFKTLDEYHTYQDEPKLPIAANKNGIGICAQQ
jgi:outer membrane protein OmpA-like peptidoglycan-associated protein